MGRKYFWCGFLIVALVAGVALPARAGIPSSGEIWGGIAGALAAVAAVTIVVIYEVRKKKTITGCVSSGPGGLAITDEKDKRAYALSGSPGGVTPGDRVKLQVKKVKSTDPAKSAVWATKNVIRDFGVCQP
jgi:hypothetical protein